MCSTEFGVDGTLFHDKNTTFRLGQYFGFLLMVLMVVLPCTAARRRWAFLPCNVSRYPGRLLFRLKLGAARFISASCCLRGDYEYEKLLIVDCLIVDC